MKRLEILVLLLLVANCFSANAQTLTVGLQAHYNFEQNLDDATPNQHDLQEMLGAASYEVVSGSDFAIVFDGSTSVSTVSSFDNSSYTEIAVSLWVKSGTITASNQICIQGAYMGFGAYIEANTGHIMGFFDGSSVGSLLSSVAITDNMWHHIVIQSDGSTTSMYLDGAFDGSISEPLSVGNGSANNRLYLGRSNLDLDHFFGSMNDTRIYNRILTLAEITELRAKHLNPGNEVGIARVIGEVAAAEELQAALYPNPTTDRVVIDLQRQYAQVTVEITNVVGQTILRQSFQHQQQITFSIDGAPGIYFVTLDADEQRIVRRVVKQ